MLGGWVLRRLRGVPDRRPTVDPNLAGGLRAWLEDGVAGLPSATNPIRVRPHHLAALPTVADDGSAAALAALIQTYFRQVVVADPGPQADAMTSALAGLNVEGRAHHVVDVRRGLSPEAAARLAREVTAHAAHVRQDWASVPASWRPRTDVPMLVPLGAGNVVLSAAADLVLGEPSSGRASVCLVDVRVSRRDSNGRTSPGEGPDRLVAAAAVAGADRARRHFLALVETLRSGAAPLRVATYRTADGSLEVEDVGDELLAAAVETVLRTVGGTRC